jgi:hypothetical protein
MELRCVYVVVNVFYVGIYARTHMYIQAAFVSMYARTGWDVWGGTLPFVQCHEWACMWAQCMTYIHIYIYIYTHTHADIHKYLHTYVHTQAVARIYACHPKHYFGHAWNCFDFLVAMVSFLSIALELEGTPCMSAYVNICEYVNM